MNNWQIISHCDYPQATFGLKQIAAVIREETGTDPDFGPERADKSRIILSLDPALPEAAYRLSVSPEQEGVQVVSISGQDENALMYGCLDFVNITLVQAQQAHSTFHPYYFHKLFGEHPLPETDVVSAPSIKRRGLWTWGMAVYDYRAYLEAMARLKFNEVIFWNDFAPVNGREVVDYAHSLGIKVIWGYAWGWDTTMRLDVSDEAAERIAAQYEAEYADLGADGIYFQSFTETTQETLGGRLIAEAVVEFVNRTAALILKKHPGLRLQFGLHALSVKNHLNHIAGVDPRIEIIWEDCGDFPYHYIPSHIEDPAATAAFTEKMLDLRASGLTGAVLKGMICLNWEQFRHEPAPAIMGCASEATIGRRLAEARRVWKYVQAEWMVNGDVCRRTVEQLARGDVSLYGLVEDGLLEREIPLPVALFAQILWDCRRPFSETLRETAQRRDAPAGACCAC